MKYPESKQIIYNSQNKEVEKDEIVNKNLIKAIKDKLNLKFGKE